MRIALISDIHYGAMSTTNDLAIPGESMDMDDVSNNAKPFFQGLIESLKKEKPDYLFVAGDLTSTGSPLEFKNCYEKIFQLAKEVNIIQNNVILCLGNHDIDWRITRLIDLYKKNSKSTYSNEDIDFLERNYHKMACSWAENEINKLPDTSTQFVHPYNKAPLTGVIECEDCIIFVLNSGHLCSHDESKKHGSLSAEQLKWFKDSVKQYDSSEKIKIVLLHHHPVNYPFPLPGRDISTLEEGSELYEICGESGVALVLHGHRHHPKAKTVSESGWENPVTYICAGSLSVNAAHRLQGAIPNTFHVIEYNNHEQIILKNYEYSLTNGWTMTKDYRDEVPLEGYMLLGKPINVKDQTTIELIKKLPINKEIKFGSLNNDLSYLCRHRLIELVEQTFCDCTIYPKQDHFIIFKPSEGDA
jgi:predicted phosphodiesterase